VYQVFTFFWINTYSSLLLLFNFVRLLCWFPFFCTELGVILNGLWLRENVIQIACSSYFFAQNFD